MGLRLLTPFLNSSFFSSSWCEAVSFELCSFNKAAMPQGFKLSKETSPEQNCNEQLGSDFVFRWSVSKEAALAGTSSGLQHLLCSSPGCGYFPGPPSPDLPLLILQPV